jgi:transcriptional regulator with XRE-family HTH domain
LLIGDYIKLHRKELGWSQEKLCQEICVVSYISKIENNNIHASRTIIRLLLSRLATSHEEYDTILKNNKNINHLLSEFISSYREFDYKKCSELIPEIKGKVTKVSKEYYLYNIYLSIYLLSHSNIDEVNQIYINLSKDTYFVSVFNLHFEWN